MGSRERARVIARTSRCGQREEEQQEEDVSGSRTRRRRRAHRSKPAHRQGLTAAGGRAASRRDPSSGQATREGNQFVVGSIRQRTADQTQVNKLCAISRRRWAGDDIRVQQTASEKCRVCEFEKMFMHFNKMQYMTFLKNVIQCKKCWCNFLKIV